MKNILIINKCMIHGQPVAGGTEMLNVDNSIAAPLLAGGQAILLIFQAQMPVVFSAATAPDTGKTATPYRKKPVARVSASPVAAEE